MNHNHKVVILLLINQICCPTLLTMTITNKRLQKHLLQNVKICIFPPNAKDNLEVSLCEALHCCDT